MTVSTSISPHPSTPLNTFKRTTLIKGKPVESDYVKLYGQNYSITRGPVTVVGLDDEWYEDVKDPEAVIKSLGNDSKLKPDIFTFWQRLPETEPKYVYPIHWESLAVLPIKSYDHWLNTQIKSRTRNLIRKAAKEGIEMRECSYDDDFVRGMTTIFNEAPVRQGRRFWHYGKDFETIKKQFSRFIHRENMIGAYYQGELIGFIMMGNAGNYGITGQIISSIKHRDKATNNALIAKAVEVCEKKRLPYLVYLFWSDDSLSEFKRRCGFELTKMPRYYVPLTRKGRLALKLGIHRGLKAALPMSVVSPLKKLRKACYECFVR